MCPTEVLSQHGQAATQVCIASLVQEKYSRLNARLKAKNQYLVPYLMSSHPGRYLKGALRSQLAEYLRDPGLHAGAGAGLLPHAVDHFHLHVLYRSCHTKNHGARVRARTALTRRPCSVP